MTEVMKAAVAVIGAGPAGVAAAVSAAEAGAGVIMIDEGTRGGGQIWRHRRGGDLPPRARRWMARLDHPGIRHLGGTTLIDALPGGELIGDRRGESVGVHAERVIIATGARERFLPFPGWTLPNVMGIGALQALTKAGLSFRGRSVVLAGSGPLLWPVAALLSTQGARVEMVAEQAPGATVREFGRSLWREPGKLLDAIRYRAAFLNTPLRHGTWVSAASGAGRLEEITLTDGSRTWSMPCEVLGTGFGLVPNLEVARRLGCDSGDDRVEVDDNQQTTVPGVLAAGEVTGVAGVESALVEGEIAGRVAVGQRVDTLRPRRDRARAFGDRLATTFALRPELRELARPDTIICRCEDVAAGALDPRWTTRQAKLYTRAGMGTCQGRVCGPALRFLYGWAADTVRPPLKPVGIEQLVSSDPASDS